jgi:hypothetical protein
MNRYCEPVNCTDYLIEKRKFKIDRVVEFYVQTIEAVKSMTYKELNKKDAFRFLIKIDEEVDKKIPIEII